MSNLLDNENAVELSKRLALFGEQWFDICAELANAGYGVAAAVERAAIEEVAQTNEGRARLHAYWREWAKERLAGLTGPIDILRGGYSNVSAYRSTLLQTLREESSRIIADGKLISPQIEPTLKRYIETSCDEPDAKLTHARIKQAKEQAVSSLHLAECADFSRFSENVKYRMLFERYRLNLQPAGFIPATPRNDGLVFRKLTTDKRWMFALVDVAGKDAAQGMLYPMFALTLPEVKLIPGALPSSAVATFSPEDIVPRFRASRLFDRNSYAEFCLTIDTISALTQIVYARLNRVLLA